MAAADRIMTGLDRRKRAGGRSAEEKNRSRRSRKADAEEPRRTVEFTVPLPEKRQKEERKIVIILFEVLILLSVIIFAAYLRGQAVERYVKARLESG